MTEIPIHTITPMVIVLYWYDDLSYINATILVSQTECKLVSIDPCILEFSCNDVTCSSYLKSSRDIIELKYKNNYLTISYIKAKCIIIQLESSEKITLKWKNGIPTWCFVVLGILDANLLVTQVKL